MSVFFRFPDVPSQPSDEGRAVEIWLQGRAFGKMSPKCRSTRVPVLTCIDEGAERLGGHCEGPGFIPLGGLLGSVSAKSL